jgi:hypothetical protein
MLKCKLEHIFGDVANDERCCNLQFLVIISFIKLILLKIRVRNVKF